MNRDTWPNWLYVLNLVVPLLFLFIALIVNH